MNAVVNRKIYKLRSQPLIELDNWLESYRRIRNEKFDRLDNYLRELQSKGNNDGIENS